VPSEARQETIFKEREMAKKFPAPGGAADPTGRQFVPKQKGVGGGKSVPMKVPNVVPKSGKP